MVRLNDPKDDRRFEPGPVVSLFLFFSGHSPNITLNDTDPFKYSLSLRKSMFFILITECLEFLHVNRTDCS